MTGTPLTGGIERLRLVRAEWRNLETGAAALEAAFHPSAPGVRHDADRLGRAVFTLYLACILCHQPTPVEVTVSGRWDTGEPPRRDVAPRMVLVTGGEPEAVLCGQCNAATSAAVEQMGDG